MEQIRQALRDTATEIAKVTDPESFDFEAFFLSRGCASELAGLLAEYFPCACGRAFLVEIGVKISDTYQRKIKNGEWGQPEFFKDDSIWLVVESVAQELRIDPKRRRQFSLVAQHSAELDAVNNAVNNGMKIEDLADSEFTSVFLKPRKIKS